MIDFAYETYKQDFGVTLVLNGSDTKALKDMLIRTQNLPEFGIDALRDAWLAFLRSPKSFDREQAHPLRYWSSSINRFMIKPNGNGNLDAARKFVKENLRK